MITRRSATQTRGLDEAKVPVAPVAPVALFPCGSARCSDDVIDGIKCDFCSLWFHETCSKLSRTALDLYDEHKVLKWACPNCVMKLKKRGSASPPAVSSKKTPIQVGRKPEDESLADKTPRVEPLKKTQMPKNRVQITKATANNNGGLHCKSCKGSPGNSKDSRRSLEEEMDNQGKKINELVEVTRILGETITKLTKQTDSAFGRSRNVVIKGIPEPYCREATKRSRELRQHITSILRMARIPGDCEIKRILRLGKWHGPLDSQVVHPRPTLVELVNPRYRDALLTAAGDIHHLSNSKFMVVPDCSANWLQGPKPPTKGALVGNPKDIPQPLLVIPRIPSSSPPPVSKTSPLKTVDPPATPTRRCSLSPAITVSKSPVPVSIRKLLRKLQNSPKTNQKNGTGTRTPSPGALTPTQKKI